MTMTTRLTERISVTAALADEAIRQELMPLIRVLVREALHEDWQRALQAYRGGKRGA